MQSLLPALYPMLKAEFHLDYGQVGMITLAFMLTASFLQPTIGIYTDRKAQPYSLAVGMGGTLIGLVLLSVAHNYAAILLAAAFIGTGSAVFHPEASRVSRGSPRAAATASRNRSSRSAATSAARSARCSPPSSSCRAARARSSGSRSWRCSP